MGICKKIGAKNLMLFAVAIVLLVLSTILTFISAVVVMPNLLEFIAQFVYMFDLFKETYGFVFAPIIGGFWFVGTILREPLISYLTIWNYLHFVVNFALAVIIVKLSLQYRNKKTI